jgi:hypothetical protein
MHVKCTYPEFYLRKSKRTWIYSPELGSKETSACPQHCGPKLVCLVVRERAAPAAS